MSILQAALLDTYFPERKNYFLAAKHSCEGYLHDVEAYILQEPEAQYKTIRIDTEEDVFVRNRLFKRHILRLYQSTCSFTGMRLVSRHGHSFVDGFWKILSKFVNCSLYQSNHYNRNKS